MNNDNLHIQAVKNEESSKTNEFYISDNRGTIKVVEHFTGSKTYTDIIKAALMREFGE
jgi:hypothetical protein